MEPAVGIEPTTDGLQNRCSTAELSWPEGRTFCGARGHLASFHGADFNAEARRLGDEDDTTCCRRRCVL